MLLGHSVCKGLREAENTQKREERRQLDVKVPAQMIPREVVSVSAAQSHIDPCFLPAFRNVYSISTKTYSKGE